MSRSDDTHTTKVKNTIDTGIKRPSFATTFPEKHYAAKEEFTYLLKAGIIHQSRFP